MVVCVRGLLYSTLLGLLLSVTSCHGALSFAYHNYTTMVDYLGDIHRRYPTVTDMYSIGASVEGRELWVFVVGLNPRQHVALRPDVKMVANLHGNSVVGRELLLHLIEDLLGDNEKGNATVSRLLRTTRIHFLPMMNPDGNVIATRNLEDPNIDRCDGNTGKYNANGVDLGRNFPSQFNPNAALRQPEVQAMMVWLSKYNFLLSAHLIGGIQAVLYPYGTYRGADSTPKVSVSADADVYEHLSAAYAKAHRTLHKDLPTACPTGIPGGIINGAKLGPVNGGMMDYHVQMAASVELTIGVSCCKYPPQGELVDRWQDNEDALIKFIQNAHLGVKGLVLTSEGQEIKDAIVTITGREDFRVATTPFGEFWRLLLPGSYILKVEAEGYETESKNFKVQEGSVTRLDMLLKKKLVALAETLRSLPNCRRPIFVSCRIEKESRRKSLLELVSELNTTSPDNGASPKPGWLGSLLVSTQLGLYIIITCAG